MKRSSLIRWMVCLLLLCAGTGAVRGAELAFLRRTVDLQADGSAAGKMEILPLPGQEGSECYLPLGFPHVSSLTLTLAMPGGSAGPVPEMRDLGGRPVLPLLLPSGGEPATLTVSFIASGVFAPEKAAKSPWGNLNLSLAWLNAVPNRIASAEMVVLLPPGFVVNTIDDSSPAPGREDPSLPYTFDRFDGRNRLVIRMSGMKTGDRLMLQFRMKRAGRSWGFLFAVLLAALAWLVFFRDLVAAPVSKPAEGAAPHP